MTRPPDVTEIAHQTLASIIRNLPEWEDSHFDRAAALLNEVRPHYFGDTATRRIAEVMLSHLQARQSFGFASLKVELPDSARTIDRIRQAEPVENIRTGIDALKEAGVKADVHAATLKAQQDMATLPAITVAANLAQAISSATSEGDGYRATGQIQSVVSHLEEMLNAPDAVISLGAPINALLRWGGLPVSDSDGETILVVAPSGAGKTAFAIDQALRVAKEGHLVQYNVLLDASAYQIKERMVHRIAGLSLRQGTMLRAHLPGRGSRPPETVAERLMWAESVLNELPIEIDDASPHMDQHELRVHLAQKAARRVKLSIIDNLDHLQWDNREEGMDRRYQLGRLASIIREHDRRTGHTSILLAQANRDHLNQGDGIPRGHHVADSDQPRRHCTMVLGIANPNLEEGGEATQDLKGFMSKNRAGQTGPFSLPVALVNPRAQDVGLPE